ncbi:MAG: DUF2203 domain-containing protein [Acidobacteriia bacterium]|nr:DUF2203 domain-containing protein [Terriglobia bacterium]
MTERYFTRNEAEELLPLIARCLAQAREKTRRIEGLDRELAQAVTKIMVLGGSVPPYGKLAATREERERVVVQLQEVLATIAQTGCLVKDLEQGLVDFPSLVGGEEAYLCWKLGEERIGYWHGLDEGFAGRKPLDDVTPDEPTPGPPRVQ